MQLNRSAGILLHITSLPGDFGTGDLGTSAYEFVDFLAECGQSVWQVLPLGPPAHANSPYSCYSAFAGNPLLIDIEQLHTQGLLSDEERSTLPRDTESSAACDYRMAQQAKSQALQLAFERFRADTACSAVDEFEAFCASHRDWLDDFALFSALMQHFGTDDWTTWGEELVHRDSQALGEWKQRLDRQVEYAQFVQYLFYQQWESLHDYARQRGIRLFGDMPIFVAHGSADVWSNQAVFKLREDGKPEAVAGVPPDYFSKTGQLWGNPQYDWDTMQSRGYRWWIKRFRAAIESFDIFRIDHFRGFESYWEVPATAKTAVSGAWVKGPGEELFRVAEQELGALPIVVEDLGLITDAVHELRDQLALPGMRVLQFGFDHERDTYHRPEDYPENSVAYTGTHDNATIVSWYQEGLENPMRRNLLAPYFDTVSEDAPVHWQLVEMVFRSRAALAIAPLQDLLGLDDQSRMNWPGEAEGNWGWRCSRDQLSAELAEQLRGLTRATDRWASSPAASNAVGVS